MVYVIRGLVGIIILLFGSIPHVFSQEEAPSRIRNIRVRLNNELIIASQGNDETLQIIQVRIWGTLREPSFFSAGFQQLDDDPEEEYVVISKNEGTGPYYKLQLIDFPPNGILAWAYDSGGKPTIEEQIIWLGSLPEGYNGAGTVFEYRAYTYSINGLSLIENKAPRHYP